MNFSSTFVYKSNDTKEPRIYSPPQNWIVQLKNSFPLFFFFSFHFVRIRNELIDVTKVGPSEFSSGPFLFVCQPPPECNRCLEWTAICIIPKNWNVYKVSRHSANIIGNAFYGIIHLAPCIDFFVSIPFRYRVVSPTSTPHVYIYIHSYYRWFLVHVTSALLYLKPSFVLYLFKFAPSIEHTFPFWHHTCESDLFGFFVSSSSMSTQETTFSPMTWPTLSTLFLRSSWLYIDQFRFTRRRRWTLG